MIESELNSIRELARSFLAKELAPVVLDFDFRSEFPLEIYKKFTSTGLPFLGLPPEYNGVESYQALALVAEEMGRVDPGFALSVLASSQLFGYNVARLGTAAQKEKYLGGLSRDGKVGAWALTEPDVGSDATGIKTKAQRTGNSYTLSGSKTFITNAPFADYVIVLAREEGTGIEGGTAFIVERGMPGVDFSTPFKKMGHKTSPTGQVFLQNVKLGPENVLGQPKKAFLDMKHSLDLERIVFGAIPVGMMKECCERAIRYASERIQFGQKIADFQLVQKMIAEMVTQTEMCDCYLRSLWGEAEENRNFKAAIFKKIIAEASVQVTSLAVQVFGGNGYMSEYLVEKMYRDARLYAIGGGTSEINELIVSKQAIKRMEKGALWQS